VINAVSGCAPEPCGIAYETIAGAGAMTHEFAETLPSQQRYLALAIQQMIELGLMLVEAAQDRVDQVA